MVRLCAALWTAAACCRFQQPACWPTFDVARANYHEQSQSAAACCRFQQPACWPTFDVARANYHEQSQSAAAGCGHKSGSRLPQSRERTRKTTANERRGEATRPERVLRPGETASARFRLVSCLGRNQIEVLLSGGVLTPDPFDVHSLRENFSNTLSITSSPPSRFV